MKLLALLALLSLVVTGCSDVQASMGTGPTPPPPAPRPAKADDGYGAFTGGGQIPGAGLDGIDLSPWFVGAPCAADDVCTSWSTGA
jgi:hypothetical protein